MPNRKRAAFSVQTGEPAVIQVRAADGKDYVAKVQLAVFDVWETGEINPLNNVPVFEVRANVAVDIQPKVPS